MFILNMVGLIHTAPIILVNIYTIWLLKWGYEIKTLAIENMLMAVVIFFLELYEFILYRKY